MVKGRMPFGAVLGVWLLELFLMLLVVLELMLLVLFSACDD
jgi:hypothetical protein